jgi:hypothetical protein
VHRVQLWVSEVQRLTLVIRFLRYRPLRARGAFSYDELSCVLDSLHCSVLAKNASMKLSRTLQTFTEMNEGFRP